VSRYPARVNQTTKSLGPFPDIKETWGEHGLRWKDLGGEAAMHALCPINAMDITRRQKMKLLVGGPGGPLAALAAATLQIGAIHAIVSEAEADALGTFPSPHLSTLNDLVEVAAGRHYHRVLLGFAGTSWDVHACTPWIQRLKPEGQFIVFGIAESQVSQVFEEMATKGFALRASGRRHDFAFLAGTMEHGHRLG